MKQWKVNIYLNGRYRDVIVSGRDQYDMREMVKSLYGDDVKIYQYSVIK